MSALSAVCRQEYYLELGSSLPPPLNGTPDQCDRRCWVALEAFNDLRPGNAYEGRLAMRIVLCGAHAVECLREAGGYRNDFAKMQRCRAQAASLMREERAAKRILVQEQKLRLAVEAVAGDVPEASALPPPPAHLTAAATTALAAPGAAPGAAPAAARGAAPRAAPGAALPTVQAEVAAPPPAPVPPPAEPPCLGPRTAQTKLRESDAAPPPSPQAIRQAEAFAQENFGAAAILRHDRGITPQNHKALHGVTLPADPAVMDALIRGTSRLLVALDVAVAGAFDEAA